MKAIILMGGLGTRLYPLTQNIPKGFLEINDKKIVDHIIEKLELVNEVDNIYIISHEKFFDLFYEWMKSKNYKKQIKIIKKSKESDKSWPGSVGTMGFAVDHLNIQEDLIIIGGDTLFGFDINNSINFFREKNTSIIAAKSVKDKNLIASKFGVPEINENQKIIGFEDKPKFPRSNLGSLCYYIIKKEDLDLIIKCVKEGRTDHSGDLIEFIFARRPLHCFTFESEWFDVTDQEILKNAKKFYENKD